MSELWSRLHLRALTLKTADDNVFLKRWEKQIPRYTTGCACKEFWAHWKRANKPCFQPSQSYFAWTVKAHNAVNKKLKRKEWSVEDARAYWKSQLAKLD